MPDHPLQDDTIGDLKKLVAAQTGTRPEKIRIQKWYNIYKVDARCSRERCRVCAKCWYQHLLCLPTGPHHAGGL